MGDWRWVLGLGVDESLSWGLARVDCSQRGSYPFDPGVLYHGRIPIPPGSDQFDLQHAIQSALKAIRRENSAIGEIFDQVIAIGVSTIGLADQTHLRLTSIARKPRWRVSRDHNGKSYVVDFKTLFLGLLGKQMDIALQNRPDRVIFIQNDATSQCLAEYYQQNQSDQAELIYLVIVSEGVNVGIVRRGRPIQTMLHPEAGHIYPRLHKDDTGFAESVSGCPVHGYCFEGVASGARIRNQWRQPLQDLRNHPDKPWNRIAHYVAQLCWDGALTFSPERFLIGGPVVFDELIPEIITAFDALNDGRILPGHPKLGTPYLDYDAMHKPGFIRRATLGQNAELIGALELARLYAGRSPFFPSKS